MWDLREEKGSTRVLFGACDDDLVFHGDFALHCGADLPTSVLGDLQFKALWSRYQRCHKEIPVGDVNLATCLHLGLTWLQLMTPLVGIATRDMHLLASGLENRPLFYTHPRYKPCIIF